MFHDPQFNPAKTDAWQEHLCRGDIVIFRFPIRLPGEHETAKARPCLVLETAGFAGQRYAVLAYGTSADSRANRGYDIDAKGDEAISAGLDRSTRFVGFRRMTVSLDHSGFVAESSSGSPVIGALAGRSLDRMNAVRARIFAAADIAAERRSERRPSRPRRARGKPFTVLRKTPTKLKKPAARSGS